MNDFFNHTSTEFQRSLTIELRRKTTVLSVFFFAVVSTVIMSLGTYLDRKTSLSLAPSVLWVILTLSFSVMLHQLWDPERKHQAHIRSALLHIHPGALFVSKCMVGLLLWGPLCLALGILMALFFHVEQPLAWLTLVTIPLLLSPSLFSLGALVASLRLKAQLSEVLSTTLLLPLTSPVVLIGVSATRAMMDGADTVRSWFVLGVALNAVVTTLCFLLYTRVHKLEV